jgi:hypothetical protein
MLFALKGLTQRLLKTVKTKALAPVTEVERVGFVAAASHSPILSSKALRDKLSEIKLTPAE